MDAEKARPRAFQSYQCYIVPLQVFPCGKLLDIMGTKFQSTDFVAMISVEHNLEQNPQPVDHAGGPYKFPITNLKLLYKFILVQKMGEFRIHGIQCVSSS